MKELLLREWPNLLLIVIGYVVATYIASRVYWGFQYESSVKDYKKFFFNYHIIIGLIFYLLGTVKLELLQIRVINLMFLAFIVLVTVVDVVMYVWSEKFDNLIETLIKE